MRKKRTFLSWFFRITSQTTNIPSIANRLSKQKLLQFFYTSTIYYSNQCRTPYSVSNSTIFLNRGRLLISRHDIPQPYQNVSNNHKTINDTPGSIATSENLIVGSEREMVGKRMEDRWCHFVLCANNSKQAPFLNKTLVNLTHHETEDNDERKLICQ